VDQTTIADANDVNSLATEVQGIETIVGVNPQIEGNPPTGSQVTYSTMGNRVSDAANNNLLPYVVLQNSSGFFINAGKQTYNTYTQQTDPFQIWNGQDITIPCNGYWSVYADQKWNQKGNNFRGGNVLFMYLNGSWIVAEIWDWSANFANTAYNYATNIFNSNGYSRINWEGLLHKGDRIQMLSANSTFCPGIQVTNMSLKAMCHRTIASTQTFKSG
jgi:hypothetical protein